MIKTTLDKVKIGFHFKVYPDSRIVRKKVEGDRLHNTVDLSNGFKQKFKQNHIVYISSELGLK